MALSKYISRIELKKQKCKTKKLSFFVHPNQIYILWLSLLREHNYTSPVVPPSGLDINWSDRDKLVAMRNKDRLTRTPD